MDLRQDLVPPHCALLHTSNILFLLIFLSPRRQNRLIGRRLHPDASDIEPCIAARKMPTRFFI